MKRLGNEVLQSLILVGLLEDLHEAVLPVGEVMLKSCAIDLEGPEDGF
jgi:hypothetical protein